MHVGNSAAELIMKHWDEYKKLHPDVYEMKDLELWGISEHIPDNEQYGGLLRALSRQATG